jgi:hypothetical protein
MLATGRLPDAAEEAGREIAGTVIPDQAVQSQM